jgi:arylsulfatase A-like enzyme
MDYYPTVLDYTGIGLNPDQHIDGISLKPLLEGETKISHEQLFWDFPHYHGSGWTPGRAMRKGPWKLIYFFENEIYELYNLDNDIGEQNNLAAIYPEKLKEMKKLLNVWGDEINAQKPKINENFK